MEEKIPIIEQGFICDSTQYYMVGAVNPKSLEKVPYVAIKNKRKYFCARVSLINSVTKSYRYFKADKLPGDVVDFLNKNDYTIKTDKI